MSTIASVECTSRRETPWTEQAATCIEGRFQGFFSVSLHVSSQNLLLSWILCLGKFSENLIVLESMVARSTIYILAAGLYCPFLLGYVRTFSLNDVD